MSLFHLLIDFVLAVAVVSAVTLLAGLFWLRRRNRVCPGVATDAPLWWLVSPRRAASAHRRLRRSVLVARAALGAYERHAGGAGSDIIAVVAELGHHAARIDAEMVVVSRLPARQRRTLERALLREVGDVERLAGRLGASLVEPSPERIAETSRRLTDRLGALEAAHAELAEIEARVMVSSVGSAPTYAGSRALRGSDV